MGSNLPVPVLTVNADALIGVLPALRGAGFDVREYQSPDAYPPALVLLVALPDTTDIAELCHRLKTSYGASALLCLSDSREVRLGALEAGADACLPASADPTEIVAAVRALVRAVHQVTHVGAARRQAEAGVRLSEQRYRSLVEATAAVVWNTPASGEFETEQPGWSAFTGQDFAHLKGWGWLCAVHPDDRPETARVWSAAVASRTLYQVEHRLRRHDGEYRHMLVRAVPILDEAGAIREWVGVHTDIHDIKRAQVILREAKDAAVAANRAKSQFLANMSHEIRTPMNGVLGMAELLGATDLTTEQREYLGVVRSSAESLLGVINDILDLSKIEAGKMTLEPIEFDLRAGVSDAISSLGARARSKGLRLDVKIAPGVPPRLVGDPVRVRQVLLNLAGNAVKFTNKGGVDVRARCEDRDAASVLLHFEVEDTGVGIPRDKICTIFRPFEQADGSTTRKYGGTGLGLSIATQLAALMGGSIWAESQEGSGSTFHFTARFGIAGGAAHLKSPEAPRAAGPSARLRVLVADDNAVNRLLAVRLLEKRGHEVVAVEDGRAALEALEMQPFDMVLMDVQMPEIDGLEAARILREREQGAGRRMPLVALTAHAMQGDRERCMAAGMDAYLSKPLQGPQLDQVLSEVLGWSTAK